MSHDQSTEFVLKVHELFIHYAVVAVITGLSILGISSAYRSGGNVPEFFAGFQVRNHMTSATKEFEGVFTRHPNTPVKLVIKGGVVFAFTLLTVGFMARLLGITFVTRTFIVSLFSSTLNRIPHFRESDAVLLRAKPRASENPEAKKAR